MDDEKKDNLIWDLLSDKGLREGEGTQRLAHAMAAPLRRNVTGQTQKDFVYVQPEDGWREKSYANGLRRMANDPGVNPNTAAVYNDMAKAWDEYANLPKWKRWLYSFIKRHFA